jgi:ketosteroid isomerase-like protein
MINAITKTRWSVLTGVCMLIMQTTILSALDSQSTQEDTMSNPVTFNTMNNPHDELARIEETIKASIEWAVRGKDTVLLYSTVIENDELFFFQPDSRNTIQGIEAFRSVTNDFFMRDDFKAIRVEIKDMRISLSPSLRTAWYACILNDYNEFQGKPANWENVRWTGVLEKVDGEWRIFQMHFSKAEDFVMEAYKKTQDQGDK